MRMDRVPAGYQTLDAWRGIAILMVMMFHACAPAIGSQFPELAHAPFYTLCLHGGLGVTLFFVISGYCIASAAVRVLVRDSTPVRGFVRSRISRIYPPYAIASLIGLLVIFAAKLLVARHVVSHSYLAGQLTQRPSLLFVLTSLTLTQEAFNQDNILPTGWSLCYETAFYAIFAAALAVEAARKQSGIMLFLLNALTCLSVAWILISPASCPYPLGLWPLFGLGILCYSLLHVEDRRASAPLAAIAIAGLLACAIWGRTTGGAHGVSREQITCGLLFATLVIWLYRWDSWIAGQAAVKSLAKIGVFSYSLYLIHMFLFGIVYQLGKKLHLAAGNFWISYLAQIACALLAGYIFFWCVEVRTISKGRRRSVATSLTAASPAE